MMLLLAGCAPKPFLYKPHGAITRAPLRARAAVASVDNQSPPVESGWLTGPGSKSADFNFATEMRFNFTSPERMTNHLIRDLAASGLFSSVAKEGEGEADFLIKPTYRKAEVKMACVTRCFGFCDSSCWYLEMEVEMFKGRERVMQKFYVRNWDVRAGHETQDVAAQLAQLMDKVRKDIAEALKKD